MRQGINARDGEAEVWIEFEGNAKGVRLDAEPKEVSVALIIRTQTLDRQRSEIRTRKGDTTKPLRLNPYQAESPRSVPDLGGSLHPHWLAEEATRHDLAGLGNVDHR